MSDVPADLQITPSAQFQLVALLGGPEQLVEAKAFIDGAKEKAFSQRPYPVRHIEGSNKAEFDATFARTTNLTDEISKVVPWLVSFSSPQEREDLTQLIFKICVLQEQRQHYQNQQSATEPMTFLFNLPELREMYQLLERYLRNVNQFLINSSISREVAQ